MSAYKPRWILRIFHLFLLILFIVLSPTIADAGGWLGGDSSFKAKVGGTYKMIKATFKKTTERLKGRLVFQRCGNGSVEWSEQCDDGNTVNGDGCSCSCYFEPAPRSHCGNGICEVGEACITIEGVPGNDPETLEFPTLCPQDCTGVSMAECPDLHYLIKCGNCIVDRQGEACDDGNTRAEDGCSRTCTVEPGCGDGIVQRDTGEACDDGNSVNTDQCRNNCTAPQCGDRVVDTWESCDDGNLANGDGCSALCLNEGVTPWTPPECPDSVSVAGVEVDVDCECPEDAPAPTCDGDGIVEVGEECDDGNNNDSDNCTNDCRSACGIVACGCTGAQWTKLATRSHLTDFGHDIQTHDVATDPFGNSYSVISIRMVGHVLVKTDACGFKRWGRTLRGTWAEGTPAAVATDNAGNVYVLRGERPENFLRKFNPCGEEQWVQSYDPGLPRGDRTDLESTFREFWGQDLVVDGSGNVYIIGTVALLGPQRVVETEDGRSITGREVSEPSHVVHKYSQATGLPAGPPWPKMRTGLEGGDGTLGTGVALTPDGDVVAQLRVIDITAETIAGDRIWGADVIGKRLIRLNPNGTYDSGFGTTGTLNLGWFDLAIWGNTRNNLVSDLSGNLYFLGPSSIEKLNPFGVPISTYSLGTLNPRGLAIDTEGNLIIAGSVTSDAPAVRKLSATGSTLWTNTDSVTLTGISDPWLINQQAQAVALDRLNSILVVGGGFQATEGTSWIRKLTPSGVTGP